MRLTYLCKIIYVTVQALINIGKMQREFLTLSDNLPFQYVGLLNFRNGRDFIRKSDFNKYKKMKKLSLTLNVSPQSSN